MQYSTTVSHSELPLDVGCWRQLALVDLVPRSCLLLIQEIAAHLVIIKGVQTFQNGASVEYSDLDIMQMLGRAVSSVCATVLLESYLSNESISRDDLNSVL